MLAKIITLVLNFLLREPVKKKKIKKCGNFHTWGGGGPDWATGSFSTLIFSEKIKVNFKKINKIKCNLSHFKPF